MSDWTSSSTYYAYAMTETGAGVNAKYALNSGSEAASASGQVVDAYANPDLVPGTQNTFTVGGVTYTYLGTQTISGITGFVGQNGTSYFWFTTNSTISGLYTGYSKLNATNVDWNLATNTPYCFVAGTLIATPAGQVPVESLAAGDLVLTAGGATRPVRWIGRSEMSRFGVDPVHVLPVRIKAGALAENVPARDLLVSPGHAIRIGDVLVHAAALVNGTSIVREHNAPATFTYYHVELDAHDLMLAEGAPAESFLDGVEGLAFVNMADRVLPPTEAEMPYPRIKSPRQVPAAVRQLLAERAERLFGALADAA